MYTKPGIPHPPSVNRGHWLKRMGLAGFTFFLLKGLLWLLIPWLAHTAMF